VREGAGEAVQADENRGEDFSRGGVNGSEGERSLRKYVPLFPFPHPIRQLIQVELHRGHRAGGVRRLDCQP